MSLAAERIALVLDLDKDRLEALTLPRRSVLPRPVVLVIPVAFKAPLLRLLYFAPFLTIDTVLGGAFAMIDLEWLFSLTSRIVSV